MGFLAPKGPDLRAQAAAQEKALAEQRAANEEQKALIAAREEKTAIAEKAQRAVRSGRRRGLLAYTEDMSSATFGGGGG